MHARLVSDMRHTEAYIANALVPMLRVLGNDENVVIEVINEPEWCMRVDGGGTTAQLVDGVQMQRFVAAITAAVQTHLATCPLLPLTRLPLPLW